MNKRVINKIKKVLTFESEDEVYIISAIARKKNNPKLTNKAVVFKDIIKAPELFDRKFAKMVTLIENYDHDKLKPRDFNLYITFNPRSCRKAYKDIKMKFAEWDYTNTELLHLKKMLGEWVSSLQVPRNRARANYFMIDIDTEEKDVLKKIRMFARKVSPSFSKTFKTKHGYHILLKPFDVRLFEKVKIKGIIELFKDGNLNLEEVI